MISVVVPTYRRDALLERCLKRLLAQRFDPDRYEIIVVDDGPSETTRRLVEGLSRVPRPAVRYLRATEKHGPAAARNIGWRAAAGRTIAFTDDDCWPTAEWLAEGHRAVTSLRADAVTGRTLVPLPLRPTDFERDTAGLAVAEFITANCFCRRTALEAVGGFDERFTLAWREDSDLHFALLERGMKIVRAHGAVVIHPVRPMPWGISLRQQRKGIFDPLLYKKHTELYRRHIPCMPRLYYASLASLGVAAFGALALLPALVFGGLAVWLALTVVFAARRLKDTSLSPSHLLEMLVTSSVIPLLSIYWRLRGAWRYRIFQL